MNPVHTIARAEALDLELSAFFLEAWRGLAHSLRSDTFEWTLSYRAGECTEVLIVSPQKRRSQLLALQAGTEKTKRAKKKQGGR